MQGEERRSRETWTRKGKVDAEEGKEGNEHASRKTRAFCRCIESAATTLPRTEDASALAAENLDIIFFVASHSLLAISMSHFKDISTVTFWTSDFCFEVT